MTATTLSSAQYRALSVTTAAINTGAVTAAKISATLDQIPVAVASVNLNSQNIIALLDPTTAQMAATKNYVDTSIATALASEVVYKGVIDCSANPNYPASTVGWLYIVSVAGNIGGVSGIAVDVGAFILCNTTNAGGDQAAVGADFDIINSASGFVVGPGSAVSNDFATFDGTSGTVIKDSGLSLSTDGTMASDSDSLIPSQKAVVTYVGAEIAPLVTGPGSAVSLDFAMFNGTTGKIIEDTGLSLSTDGTMAGDSDVLVPSQKAVVTYVAAQIAAGVFSWNEVPSGLINSSNTTYTLAHTPTSGSVTVYQNGLLLQPGSGNDYTISGGTITMLTAPVTGDKLLANYQY